tara:strand:+ start:634 stop:945 length:312 start_codon:yes stop_codon:yes gene_type:complete
MTNNRITKLNSADRVNIMIGIQEALVMCIKLSIRCEKAQPSLLSKEEASAIVDNFSHIMTMVSHIVGLDKEECEKYMHETLSEHTNEDVNGIVNGIMNNDLPN